MEVSLWAASMRIMESIGSPMSAKSIDLSQARTRYIWSLCYPVNSKISNCKVWQEMSEMYVLSGMTVIGLDQLPFNVAY